LMADERPLSTKLQQILAGRLSDPRAKRSHSFLRKSWFAAGGSPIGISRPARKFQPQL
jgi:hypothetical protein